MSTSSKRARPTWQLPPGISRGTWDYLHSPSIADDYDSYFSDHPLLKLDIDLVRRFLPETLPVNSPQHELHQGSSSNLNTSILNTSVLNSTGEPFTIADFGCGTARVARALGPLGYRMLNVDLSRHMLLQAAQQTIQQTKAAINSAPSDSQNDRVQSGCVQANLVQLEWLRDAALDMAVCLFSSIGMIRGRQHRLKFLTNVCRSLKPNAPLILHVHNRLRSLFDPGGPAWLLKTRLSSWTNSDWEYGDRVYAYRGLPSMFLHIYSRRELVADLTAAGFNELQILPINSTSSDLLPATTRFATLRAGGYFAIAKRK